MRGMERGSTENGAVQLKIGDKCEEVFILRSSSSSSSRTDRMAHF